jgi:DNA gyrase inhibitor GyrI
MATIVKLPERRVAYTSSFGHPSTSDAFVRLEEVVPLKGNRFYATFEPRTQEYRACVTLKEGQSGDTYGLPEGVLAGGTYASARLTGEFAEIVRSIAPTFERLSEEHTRDPRRLSIEYYKRHTEVVLYLPIVNDGRSSRDEEHQEVPKVPIERHHSGSGKARRGAGNIIRVSCWNIFSVVKPVRHVCGTCGYMADVPR